MWRRRPHTRAFDARGRAPPSLVVVILSFVSGRLLRCLCSRSRRGRRVVTFVFVTKGVLRPLGTRVVRVSTFGRPFPVCGVPRCVDGTVLSG